MYMIYYMFLLLNDTAGIRPYTAFYILPDRRWVAVLVEVTVVRDWVMVYQRMKNNDTKALTINASQLSTLTHL